MFDILLTLSVAFVIGLAVGATATHFTFRFQDRKRNDGAT